MRQKWQKATVVKKSKHNENTCSLYIKCNREAPLAFIPGQFITLDLPIAEACIKRWRSYSIASAPEDACDDYDLELCISRHQSGDGSQYLCDEVCEGDILSYKGPAGNFTLDVNPETAVVMICTETGIAPFRSILRSLRSSDTLPRKIDLIHCVETEDDLLYRSEFCSLMKEIPKFRYAADVMDNKYFVGCNGDMKQKYFNKYNDTDEDIQFYICGWPKMVNDTLEKLIYDKGFDKEQVFYEIYR